MSKRCSQCGVEKPMREFRQSAQKRFRYTSMCAGCRASMPESSPATRPDRDRYHTEELRQRRRAREAAKEARSAGRLVAPDACEMCGGTDAYLQMHHRDYSKRFDVTWLCDSCHREVHRQEKEAAA